VLPLRTAKKQGLIAIIGDPSLISTRFDDGRATGLAGGWEVLRIFGRRKKAPLLRRDHELFELVKSDLGSSRIYAHASSPAC